MSFHNHNFKFYLFLEIDLIRSTSLGKTKGKAYKLCWKKSNLC